MNPPGTSSNDLTAQLADLAVRAKGSRTPALSYAVATTNGVVVAGAVGEADLARTRAVTVEDQFPWFSMTKIATATTMMRLADEGLVDLDAPIGTYLHAYDAGKHGEPTVRHLLTHTAGLGNPLPVRWVRPVDQAPDTALVASIVRRHGRPRRTPGGRAAYSNIGYLLAGQVIEAVTDTRAEEVITELVLRPLDLRATAFSYSLDRPAATGYVRAPGVLHPVLRRLLPEGVVGDRVRGYTSLRPFLVEGPAYGGLVGTPSDGARLALAHLQPEGPLGDLTAMHEITHRGRPFDHGIGWFRKPADAATTPPFVEHYGTGGGFWNAMRIYPTLGIAVVGMTNNTSTWPYDDFFSSIGRLVSHAVADPSSGPAGAASDAS